MFHEQITPSAVVGPGLKNEAAASTIPANSPHQPEATMKVLALNGSPKKKGNTAAMLKVVCDTLKEEGIQTKTIHLAPLKLQPCTACYKCAKTLDRTCPGVKGDGLNDILPDVIAADALLIGSPVWFANVTGHVKNFIDRAGIVTRANGHLLTRKVGAAVVAVRRAGALPAFDAINHFYHINGVIVPGSKYWNLAIGRAPGDCLEDLEGVETMQNLGHNMAWLLKKIHA
jgi:multimeric flavodoxin WrbA